MVSSMRLCVSVFLLCVLVSGVLFFGFVIAFDRVDAASVAKLSAPELVSVTYTDYSYDVPASTSVDPFTGKIVENPAYRVENRTLTFVINKKNSITNHSQYSYYTIRMKGSFSNEWNTIANRAIPNSDSPLTSVMLTLPSPETILSGDSGHSYYYPSEGKADFQVQTQEWGQVPSELGPPFESSHIETLLAESDWSNTKTIDFGQYSDNGTSNPPKNPSNPTLPSTIPKFRELIVIAVLCAIIAILTTVLIHKNLASKIESVDR